MFAGISSASMAGCNETQVATPRLIRGPIFDFSFASEASYELMFRTSHHCALAPKKYEKIEARITLPPSPTVALTLQFIYEFLSTITESKRYGVSKLKIPFRQSRCCEELSSGAGT
jgi:hypothetical protein